MQCPNCRWEQPEDSVACPGCGLIFAKWRERHPEINPVPAPPADSPDTPPPPPQSKIEPPKEQDDRFKLGAFHYIGALGAILFIAVLVYQFSKSKENQETSKDQLHIPPDMRMIATMYEAPPPFSPTPTLTGPPWKFQGKVIDILHLTPIQGAVITFGNAAPVTTDADGKYEAELPPRNPGSGYYAELSHPDFGNRYWEGDWSKAPRASRIFVRDQTPFHGSFEGSQDKTVELDFAMFPNKLTEKEEEEWHDTVAPPARD